MTNNRTGLALLCDEQGIIQKVMRDDLCVLKDVAGRPLLPLIDEGSADQAQDFWEQIKTRMAAFDWELNLRCADEVVTLYFAGGRVETNILVVATVSRAGVTTKFYEELMRVNNDQVNALRVALKEQAMMARTQQTQDEKFYEELTYLNNELVALQRELTKKNAELTAQRERYRCISEVISDYAYAFRVEPDGSFVQEWITGAFTRITGYDRDALDSSEWLFDLVHPDDKERLSERIQELLSGRSVITELRILTKNGDVRWIRDYGRPVWDAAQEHVVRVFGAAQDITERKQVEAALAEHTEALARSNEELQQFAYVVSHDLQEPLRMVKSYLKLLERHYKGQLDKKADDFIAFAGDGAERMSVPINSLLQFSRVDRKGQSFEVVDCELVLDHVLRNLALMIAESHAIVSHDPLPHVMGDAVQLEQVFQNLLSNALKFRGDALPKVHISADKQEDLWLFSVCDNGIGIDPKHTERIFVLFQRLHTREEYLGTGIGLAICKKIVERHGGRIWVESSVGEGTTFYFTIPVLTSG